MSAATHLLLSPDATGARVPLNLEGFEAGLGEVEASELNGRVPPARFDSHRARTTRIFQIGYNKCGTRSLYRFLQRAGIASAHFNRGLLACSIRDNLAAGKKPLLGRIDENVAFTDIQQVTRDHAIEGAHGRHMEGAR